MSLVCIACLRSEGLRRRTRHPSWSNQQRTHVARCVRRSHANGQRTDPTTTRRSALSRNPRDPAKTASARTRTTSPGTSPTCARPTSESINFVTVTIRHLFMTSRKGRAVPTWRAAARVWDARRFAPPLRTGAVGSERLDDDDLRLFNDCPHPIGPCTKSLYSDI